MRHQLAAICFLLAMAAVAALNTTTTTTTAAAVSLAFDRHRHAAEVSSSCVAAEGAALLSFKAGITSDPADWLRSWRGHDGCLWRGVRCSNTTGRVVELDLRNVHCEQDNFFSDLDSGNHWLRGLLL
jgi:hypothetical protein